MNFLRELNCLEPNSLPDERQFQIARIVRWKWGPLFISGDIRLRFRSKSIPTSLNLVRRAPKSP